MQLIVGLSQLLSKTGNIEEYNELLDTINRNAKIKSAYRRYIRCYKN
ncbi:MAG: hypothetical protein DLM72_18090 [Candidatus Nitrosopolaris wilkensis]|nr:MAG: hypothetical protein DLM72_18090 [Candidatus Nitrosopolaris wilkensis]